MPFKPDAPKFEDRTAMTVPFYEDNQKLEIPGRGTDKSHQELIKEVRALLAKLGAFDIDFISGVDDDGEYNRYGYLITFKYRTVSGKIECLALPMQSESERKKDRAIAQALYLVRDWLQSEVYAWLYKPNSVPLLPYLVDSDGRTIVEVLHDVKILPSPTE